MGWVCTVDCCLEAWRPGGLEVWRSGGKVGCGCVRSMVGGGEQLWYRVIVSSLLGRLSRLRVQVVFPYPASYQAVAVASQNAGKRRLNSHPPSPTPNGQ